MAAPWSGKGSKSAPLVTADQFLILDSEDAVAATKNKRVTLGTVQTNLVTNMNGNDNNITNLGALSINDSTNNNTFTFSSSVDLVADRIINLPLLTANDTLVLEGFTQTLTNKTLTTPIISTISNTGTLTLPTSTDVLVGRATTDTLTNKTLTTPIISTISNTGTLTLPTSTDTLVGRATTDTLTNKTIALGNNSVSGTTAQFNTALTDDTFALLGVSNTFTENQAVTRETTVDTSDTRVNLTNFSNNSNNGSLFIGRRSRGTIASPTAVQNGDAMLTMSCVGGVSTTPDSFGLGGLIQYMATENWSVANNGTKIRFSTVKTGGTVLTSAFEVIDGTLNLLTNPIVNTKALQYAQGTLTAGSGKQLDFSGQEELVMDLTATTSFVASINVTAGRKITIFTKNSTGGSLSITLASSWKRNTSSSAITVAAGKSAKLELECTINSNENGIYATATEYFFGDV